MKYLNNYIQFEDKLYEEFQSMDFDIDWNKINILPKATIKKNIKKNLKAEYLKKLGRKGELLNYIEQGHENELTFGILRALFNDAITYKKKREFTKGFYKFIHRAIPMALAGIWFPIWIIAQILGGTRSLNKILVPVLRMKQTNYKNFLVSIITKTMNLMEGEIKMFMQDDWFYRVFMVDWGLIRMIRKEHILDFAIHVAEKMESEPNDKIAPPHYIENELRIYLNNKFELNPPLPIRTNDNFIEESYTIYENKFLAS